MPQVRNNNINAILILINILITQPIEEAIK